MLVKKVSFRKKDRLEISVEVEMLEFKLTSYYERLMSPIYDSGSILNSFEKNLSIFNW